MDLDLPQLKQEEVLSLIVSQLAEYGFNELAQVVADQTHTQTTIAPSSRLSELLYTARYESEELEPTDLSKIGNTGSMGNDDDDDGDETGSGLTRLNMETDPKPTGRSAPAFNPIYSTTHKDAVTCTAFSRDGRYCATGSADTSLKVLDVFKMKLPNDDIHPVIRTLYDHTSPVTDLDFHPNGLVLAAASDTAVKLYDLSKPNVKRSFRYLQDTHNINAVSFHPSGDFLLVATEAETIKIYDVKTLQCFSPKTFQQPPLPPGGAASVDSHVNIGPHRAGINDIQYGHSGSVFLTGSKDGTIKIWDAVAGRVTRTIENAHGGQPVTTVQLSKSGRYILSGGLDSNRQLWDIGSGKLIHSFQGAAQQTERQSTCFSWNEDIVFSTDEANQSIVLWDSRTAALLKRIPVEGGPAARIRSLSASPSENGFVTGSQDFRVRYWTTPAVMDKFRSSLHA
ncbi:hypothetical protein BGZ73_005258 [Actinomortierella ambigua]|nr:hypothetical protein BGZ73_005258 [Actinomortierella ambigua]